MQSISEEQAKRSALFNILKCAFQGCYRFYMAIVVTIRGVIYDVIVDSIWVAIYDVIVVSIYAAIYDVIVNSIRAAFTM